MTSIGPWDAAVATCKAATYATTLSASGGMFFLALSHDLIEPETAGRIGRLILALSIAAVLASAAKILATAASMSGDLAGLVDSDLIRLVLQTGEGRASLGRSIGLLIMCGSLTMRPTARLPALIGAVAAATSFAWVGHVHALAPGLVAAWLPPLVLAMHLLGAAFWLGALVPLLMVAGDDRAPGLGPAVALRGAVVARFGTAASWVVAGLVAAGVALLFLLLHAASDLWSSTYGRSILAKIALVGCLLGLAAFNHFRLTPRLIAQDAAAWGTFKASLWMEISVAGTILLVTAALTTLTGPGLDPS